MRVVIALGGNALLRRGEPMTIERQAANVEVACDRIAPVAATHELVIAHGNGPQIGLLALEDAAYEAGPDAPLDVLGAETQGMIGYLIARELGNRLPRDRSLATLLTMIDVDPDDPAFSSPTKPIGPRYDAAEADAIAAARGWVFRPDGDRLRRVVPSPSPLRVVEHREIRWLLERGCVVICAGGGGIPTAVGADGRRVGIEAVIDKDHTAGLLARDLDADVFVMATDVSAVFLGFATATPRRIEAAHPDAILPRHGPEFAVGSMLPKVTAACEFARVTGRPAVIGALADIDRLVAGGAGTRIDRTVEGVVAAPER